ncbi:Ig-like domain-containing protein [Flavobacterium sp. 5]|uniref:Ig-like domain-containing protein n=1 Tax=Flavobacterium sp. 5 TaxID=2035199 RepID=UPI000C2B58A5|nr:Ig-like domain-containing protein [Flavobacterium sp. 5]PKB15519.1 Ig-like protein group 2 [Flavobacterium sp. 5]
MTKIKFLLFTLLCAVITLQTTGCSSSDDGGNDNGNGGSNVITVTGVSLDKTTLSLKEGATATLGATLAPAGATGNVSWSSSDATVASVNNSGVVTAVKKGTASIVAAIGTFTATCVVTVTGEDVVVTDPSLSGSNYFVLQLDDVSFASIQSKVTADLRPDDVNKNLYIWENTLSAGTPAGTNFYGLSQGWVSLVVGTVGWSGAGWNTNADFGPVDMTDLFDNPGDYYLHIGYKTSQTGRPIAIIVNDGNADGKFSIGGDFVDNGTTYPSFATITTDGKWNSIEVPVTKLNELGLFFDKPLVKKNILAVLGGGTAGTTIDLDAIFYYKKAK